MDKEKQYEEVTSLLFFLCTQRFSFVSQTFLQSLYDANLQGKED